MRGPSKARNATAAVLVAASVALTVGACGSDDKSTSAKSATASGAADTSPAQSIDGKSVYLVAPGDINPWTKTFNHAVVDSLGEAGAKVTYLQDPFDPVQQVQNLNRAVAAKPDMILVIGLDNRSLVPGITKAKAAGIDVVNLSNPPGPLAGLIVASIESNHEELGKFAAQNIAEGLKAEGKATGNVIMVNGNSGANQVETRVAAFKQELAKTPGLKIVAEVDGNWDQATSQKLAQQLFAKYKDKGGIQGAYGMADNQAVGIIAAAKQSGIPVGGKDGLVVSGSNCYRFGLEAVTAGQMFGTATQSPKEEAAFTSDIVKKLLAGEKVPARSFAPETRVTAENAQQLLDQDICP